MPVQFYGQMALNLGGAIHESEEDVRELPYCDIRRKVAYTFDYNICENISQPNK
jgi:hypothetical protein